MKYEDFEEGKPFYTGVGKWLCLEKDETDITAVHYETATISCFYDYDFDGCSEEDEWN